MKLVKITDNFSFFFIGSLFKNSYNKACIEMLNSVPYKPSEILTSAIQTIQFFSQQRDI